MIGDALKIIITDSKLEYSRVFRKSKMTRTTLMSLINNDVIPRRDLMERLLDTLSIDFYELFMLSQGSRIQSLRVRKHAKERITEKKIAGEI